MTKNVQPGSTAEGETGLRARLTSAECLVLDEMERTLIAEPKPDIPQGPLFHYTTADAFSEIIRTKEIWATHFRFLNDRSELLHGEEIVQQEAEDLRHGAKEGTPAWAVLSEFSRTFPTHKLTNRIQVYVASLSEEGDQLSQWRAYGSHGAGYAIGFDKLPLPRRGDSNAHAGLGLYKCSYDDAAFKSMVRETLLEVSREFENVCNRADREEATRVFLANAVSIAYQRLVIEIPRLKHPSFEEEKEWRLVVSPPEIAKRR